MRAYIIRPLRLAFFLAFSLSAALTQATSPTVGPAPLALSGGDKLLGAYGPYRANNDLLYYHLHVRVDPARQFLSGMNAIRFRMLEDGNRIQLDLVPTFQIDGISLERAHGAPMPLTYQRIAGRTIYVDFPHTLRNGQIYTVDFHYSGHLVEMGRFGGFVFRKDPMGRPLVNTACEEEGASVWWPNKNQWRDEVESMDISVEAPSDLVEVSGGRFQGKTDLHDGFTRWDWKIMTTDVAAFFNAETGLNLTPIFNQYLRYAAIPTLELRFDETAHTVSYRWDAEESGFAMPIRVGRSSNWQIAQPSTTEWKVLSTPVRKEDFEVATNLYYVNVRKQ